MITGAVYDLVCMRGLWQVAKVTVLGRSKQCSVIAAAVQHPLQRCNGILFATSRARL